MKNRELIDLLSSMPPEADVELYLDEEFCDFEVTLVNDLSGSLIALMPKDGDAS